MEPNPSAGWDDGLRKGDPKTAEAVFHRYVAQLVRVAEQHLSRKIAGRLGSEDVVQSVFRTFFRRAEAGEFRIDSSAQLWRLLVKITVLKAQAKGRHHTAGKRAAGAETGDELLAAAAGRDPNPAEAAELVDLMDKLLQGLPESYAQVLERRLAGDSVADVAVALGISRQSVYRMLNYLQERLGNLDPTARPADDPEPEPPR